MNSALVLLHGFTGSPRSFERVVGLLGSGRNTLMPVLVGHGRGARLEVDGFDAEVDRLAELVQRARIAPARLAGYSLGARLAIGLLVRHPTLFTDAVLIGAQPGLATDSERADRRRADELWCRVLEQRGLEAFVDAWQKQALFASQARLPAVRLEQQRRQRLAHTVAGLVQSLRTTGLGVMPCYSTELASVTHPVRLVAGELDTKFRALAEQMAKVLRHAHIEIVAGAGHNVVLERPGAVAVILGAREAAA